MDPGKALTARWGAHFEIYLIGGYAKNPMKGG
jgi:hypothetical protein